MERLLEYVSHHPVLVGIAVLAVVMVLVFESRSRSLGAAAITAQDLIRLMNQGALVLDIRKADEFANLACFLASDAASYITGTAINVDGGHSPVM